MLFAFSLMLFDFWQ